MRRCVLTCSAGLVVLAILGHGGCKKVDSPAPSVRSDSTAASAAAPRVSTSESSDSPQNDDVASQPTSRESAFNDPSRRAAFLKSRMRTDVLGMMEMGSFNGMSSALYAFADVLIYCTNEQMCRAQLTNPFPNFYKPTWAEFFNAIAVCTDSHWSYDQEKEGFVFAEPPLSLPFELVLAKGWQAERHGVYVGYIPPQAPVGMDIYLLGEYSAEADEADLHRRVRDAWALRFAEPFDAQISVEKMQKVEVDGAEALFFSGAHLETKRLWRQWVFIKNRTCFGVVSAVEPEQDDAMWPDVQAMVASLRLLPSPSSSTQP